MQVPKCRLQQVFLAVIIPLVHPGREVTSCCDAVSVYSMRDASFCYDPSPAVVPRHWSDYWCAPPPVNPKIVISFIRLWFHQDCVLSPEQQEDIIRGNRDLALVSTSPTPAGTSTNTVPTFLCNWFCVKKKKNFPPDFSFAALRLQHLRSSSPAVARCLSVALAPFFFHRSQRVGLSVWWVNVQRGAREETPPSYYETHTHTHMQEAHTHTLTVFGHTFKSRNVSKSNLYVDS